MFLVCVVDVDRVFAPVSSLVFTSPSLLFFCCVLKSISGRSCCHRFVITVRVDLSRRFCNLCRSGRGRFFLKNVIASIAWWTPQCLSHGPLLFCVPNACLPMYVESVALCSRSSFVASGSSHAPTSNPHVCVCLSASVCELLELGTRGDLLSQLFLVDRSRDSWSGVMNSFQRNFDDFQSVNGQK